MLRVHRHRVEATHATTGGPSFPLGATPTSEGLNVAVSSEIADAIEVCLFDQDGVEHAVELPERTAHVWHGLLPDVGPGQRYGLLAHGTWDPAAGLAAIRPNF